MTRKVERLSAAALTFLVCAVTTTRVVAQEAEGDARAGMALPGAQATALAGDSDHDRNIGSLAVGFLGRRSMLVGSVTGGGAGGLGAVPDVADVDAQVIGVRYWIDEMLGIDAGLGFAIASESGSDGGTDVDGPSTTAFILHGGVPLSLADAGHFSFQIVPELNVGFGGQSVGEGAGEVSGSGFHLDVGARAGAEVHFGFIGVPQLSLQGSVGVLIALDNVGIEGPGDTDLSGSRFGIGTTVYDNPWNIFTSNVAALYYF